MIVGIDPGFSGAIALLDPTTRSLTIHDMPVIKNQRGKNETDGRELLKLLDPSNHEGHSLSMLEHVGPHPRDGKDKVWTFAEHIGNLKLALLGCGYERHSVTPAKWKAHFRLSKEKSASRFLAMDRFPNEAEFFSRVKDDGRAEAALLALYALETLPMFQGGR